MAIPADKVSVDHHGMERAGTTTSNRGSVARLDPGSRSHVRREAALKRARVARRELKPRSERFAHLKRMYD
jgi:hypothetical protein